MFERKPCKSGRHIAILEIKWRSNRPIGLRPPGRQYEPHLQGGRRSQEAFSQWCKFPAPTGAALDKATDRNQHMAEVQWPDFGFAADTKNSLPNNFFQFRRIDKPGADLMHYFQRKVSGGL